MQHFGEGFGRGAEVKAFSRGVVVGGNERVEASGRERCEIGLARQETAHAADGVLDATFLPGRVRVAEERLDREPVQRVMMRELGAVIESDGPAQPLRQVAEQLDQPARDRPRLLGGRPTGQDDAGLALVHGEHGLTVFGEHHQVAFPMAAALAAGCGQRPFGYRNPAFDEACRAAALYAAEPTSALAAWQVVPPGVILAARDLGIDEAIDALIADDLATILLGQPAGDLLGRPAASETLEHDMAQPFVPFEARAGPAPRLRLFMRVARLVADLFAAVALYLASNRRWRAIQSCRDLPDRAPIGLKAGNLTPVFQ